MGLVVAADFMGSTTFVGVALILLIFRVNCAGLKLFQETAPLFCRLARLAVVIQEGFQLMTLCVDKQALLVLLNILRMLN